MLIDMPDPSQVALQVVAQDSNGTPKSNVVSASVRVYHIVGGVEVDVLGATALTQVGTSSTWRYVWEPVSLGSGQYVVEYSLSDDLGATFVGVEDLAIRDFAKQEDLEFIRAVESGRWKIVGNQMIFYDEDGVAELMRFNLFDEAGFPTMGNVFERVRVV